MSNKVSYIIAILILCLSFDRAGAQEVYTSSGKSMRQVEAKKKKEDQKFSADKIIVGGGLGLSFGTITNISVMPKIGYRFTENFAAGIGLGYNYFRWKNYYEIPDTNGAVQNYDYKTSMYSVSVWARYVVWRNLFAHLEYEHNFMSFTDYGFDPGGSGTIVGNKINYNAGSLLVGAGIRQPVGDRFSVTFAIYYDVLQNEYSPYYKRVFPQIGFYMNF
jgi:hypothetical protein